MKHGGFWRCENYENASQPTACAKAAWLDFIRRSNRRHAREAGYARIRGRGACFMPACDGVRESQKVQSITRYGALNEATWRFLRTVAFQMSSTKDSMKPIAVLSEVEICAVFGITLPKWKRWQREGAPAGDNATEPAIRAWLAGSPGSYSVAPDVTAFVDLPATAQMVADVIGRDATLLLCAKVITTRHRRFYVPLAMSRGKWIAEIIGQSNWEALHKSFAGEDVVISRCSNLARAARKAAIQRAFVSGITVARLAVIYAITERLVHYYVRELRKNDTRRNKNAALTINRDIAPLRVGSSRGCRVRVDKHAQGFSSEQPEKRRVGTETSRARSKRGSK